MNEKIFHFLNSLTGQSVFTDRLIYFLSNDFGYILIIVSFLYLIFINKESFRQKTKEIIILLSSVVLAWLIVLALKYLFINPRPFLVYPDINTLFLYGSNDSFPSGHATFYGALAIAIFAYHRKAGVYFVLGAILIGLSRVASGVHFPLDIVFGFILGASVSVLTYVFIRFLAKKYKKHIDFLFNKV